MIGREEELVLQVNVVFLIKSFLVCIVGFIELNRLIDYLLIYWTEKEGNFDLS